MRVSIRRRGAWRRGRGAWRRAVATLMLLALFCVPAPAGAQLDTPTSPLPVFEMADRQGWVMRTTLADGAVVTGRVRDIDGTSVRLEGGRFDVADVATIDREQRVGGGGRTGLLIGGIALVAGAVLVAVNGFPADGGSGGAASALVVIVAIAAVGAVIGGLVGAALDPAEEDWLRVWPGGDAP